ncbi:MAG: hypothetical protein ACLU38_12365 [Dysosmobacter sp.]
MALGGLLNYLYETQKTGPLPHPTTWITTRQGRFMELDLTARPEPGADGDPSAARRKRAALLWVLDKTRTPMGGRMLRKLAGAAACCPSRTSTGAAARVAALVDEHHRAGGAGPRRSDRPGGHGAAHRPHRLRHRRRPGSDALRARPWRSCPAHARHSWRAFRTGRLDRS